MPKLTKLQTYIQKGECARRLFEGRVLAIDPSISSRSSSMGYAVYDSNQLIDAGILEISSGLDKNLRLQMIGKTLREEFDSPDVLVIENIAPMRALKKGAKYNPYQYASMGKSWKHLHQATGAAIASLDTEYIVEVAPVTWRKYIDETYEKSDANDAVLIGYAALLEACDYLDEERPVKYFLKESK